MVKLGWRFIKNLDDKWVKLLRVKYLRKSSFWETKQSKSTSSSWKTILSSRVLLKEGVCWSVASRHYINIWEDPWVPGVPYYRISENTTWSPKRKVAELIDQPTRSWRLDILTELFPTHVVEVIRKIYPNIVDRNDNDTPIWTFTTSGNFSPKSAYT